MSFTLKGSQISAIQLKGWFKSKNIKIKYKTHIKLVHELYGTCFRYNVIIENQSSNSTYCSDNALRLLVLVASKLY